MDKLKVENNVKQFLLMTVSTMINVVGTYFFKFPNNFSFGGVTGAAVILGKFTNGFLTKGSIVFILNMVLLLIGFAVFGKKFGAKTAYCSILMSVALEIMERFWPLEGPLTNQPVLELCYAVALPAVGAAILFNIDASTGGTDIVAMLLKKFTDLDIGKALMLSDLVLTIGVVLVYDIQTGLLSFVGLILKSLVIDSVIESINLCKYCTVVCSKPQPINEYITKELNRSATLCEVKGAFTGDGKTMLLTVLNRPQAANLKKYIKTVDETAFIVITNTSEIIGRGFRS